MKITSFVLKTVAGLGLIAYALFCAAIRTVYLPHLHADALSFSAWSFEHMWFPIEGVDIAPLILAFVMVGLSSFLRPPAGVPFRYDDRSGRREATCRTLFRVGAFLFCATLILNLPFASPSHSQSLEAIREALDPERARRHEFAGMGAWWGVTLLASVTALLLDAWLRRRTPRRRIEP